MKELWIPMDEADRVVREEWVRVENAADGEVAEDTGDMSLDCLEC